MTIELVPGRYADHVLFKVDGIVCVNCDNFTPGEQERCLYCGSNAVAFVEAGEIMGGRPKPSAIHHLDIRPEADHYYVLTKAELAAFRADQADIQKAEAIAVAKLREREARKAAARDALRLKAHDDPIAAALAELLDVELDS